MKQTHKEPTNKEREYTTQKAQCFQTTNQWYLKRKVGNSYLFKHVKYPDSNAYSFTITYIPDGTSVLSGDLGGLTWWRTGPQIGFPNQTTNIEYFEEKCKGMGDTNEADIREFNYTKAYEIAKEKYAHWKEEGEEEEYNAMMEKLRDVELEYEELQKNEFFKILHEYDSDYWDGRWDTYKQGFIDKFEMLKVAGETILAYEENN